MTGSPGGGESVALVASGGALDSIYRTHRRRVYSVCVAHLRDDALAEDATQETFVRASAHLNAVPASRVAAYLLVTARHVCVDEVRRRRRDVPMDPVPALGMLAREPEDVVVEHDLVERVWRRLSKRERIILVHRLAGFSYEEIASRLSVSAGAVRMLALRGRMRTRAFFDVAPAVIWAWMQRSVRTTHRVVQASVTALFPKSFLASRFRAVLAMAAVASGVSSMVGPVITHGGGAGARDTGATLVAGQLAAESHAEFIDLAVSPGYGRDRTVFASGYPEPGCRRAACPVLVRSHDGGETWASLPAEGFAGGRVLLPARYPQDPTIFATTPVGLQRSDDGGSTFRTVVPVVAPAAVAPAGPGGETQVILGSMPMRVYGERTGRLRLGPPLPADIRGIDDVAASGDGDVVLAVRRGAAAGTRAVIRCGDRGECHDIATASEGAVLHLVRPGTAPPDTVVAVSQTEVIVVRAGAATVIGRRSLGGRLIEATAVSGGRAGVTVTAALTGADRAVEIMGLSGGGRVTISAMHSTGLPPLLSVAVTPDGHLIAAVGAPDLHGWGLRCSADGGVTWHPLC